ncbi:hypothetical protein CLV63_101165 [Murinocardiopsis flavida]|uniref:Uncharacterized protein n=1 Tax=Murinocardiopsis flavida TaxID=645275 RepID=A0A2P8DU01_9ACTN|nr:peroxide stress protein YaaA [Murinocardiopsis flavida]PSL00691.1 hypothetical protein CLV63_101165 [Murinocardiopsis flavida]
MLLLLPPSEKKATDGDGPPLDLGALSLPELGAAREQVLTALEALCGGDPAHARDVLGLSAAQGDAVDRDREIRAAGTLPAAGLYTGVLYDHLRLAELLDGPSAAATRDSVLVFSGLWGVVGPTDPLPAYRLSIGTKLPPLGALGRYWRDHLGDPLTKRADGRLIVDCRSAGYAAAFTPAGDAAERTAAVRVLRETVVAGTVRRSVVSHMAKATRGAVARALLLAGRAPESPRELAEALNDLGHTAELVAADKPGRAATVNVVEQG